LDASITRNKVKGKNIVVTLASTIHSSHSFGKLRISPKKPRRMGVKSGKITKEVDPVDLENKRKCQTGLPSGDFCMMQNLRTDPYAVLKKRGDRS